MGDKPKFINAKRRGFLQGAAVATATATVTGTAVATEPTLIEPATPDVKEPGTGYRETDAVKLYYRNARF